MTGKADRMFILQYGAELVPKSLSLRGGTDELFWASFMGVLIDTAAGWILFDTGMNRAAHDSDEVDSVYRGSSPVEASTRPWHLYPPPPDDRRWTWGLPGDPMASALTELDLRPQDLSLAVISHLHWDHAGGIPSLAAAGVPVAIHTDELDFAHSGAALPTEGFLKADWTPTGVRWERLSGDTELAPGVTAMVTPGHTPGHLALRVDLQQTGTWIFAADATDLAQNLLSAVPCGSCTGPSPDAESQADASMQRLLRAGARADARLIPGHDQVILNAIRHPIGGHR